MRTIGITGGTGLVGRHVSKLLANSGYNIIVFTRNAGKSRKYIKNTSYAEWNPMKGKIDTAQLAKVDALIHLSGEGIADKRWTEQRKTDIVDSRVISTKFLAEQLRLHAPACKVFISASAIGYYGKDKGDDPFTEADPPASDFLGHTCQLWEAASEPVGEIMRRVVLRFGIVLANEGGAYKELSKPMKFGIMPLLGSGEQMVSWIHVTDLARIIRFAIERIEMTGIYNAVSPKPVSHSFLMHTMASVRGGVKVPIPVPAFALKVIMGEASVEVLKSCTVSSAKLAEEGFKFDYPYIDDAVRNLVAQTKKEKKKKEKPEA